MTDESIAIRLAIPDEAALVAEHRARMFQDMRRLDAERASTMIEQVTHLVQQMLSSGEYVGWLALDGAGMVIGGAGVQLRRLLPRPETSVTREALVVNVYVRAAYRRKGLARRLMTAILEWCREQDIERIVLHASEMGRPLYTSLGFAPSGELVLYLQ